MKKEIFVRLPPCICRGTDGYYYHDDKMGNLTKLPFRWI